MSEMIDREATVKQICKMGEMVGEHDRDVVIAIALFVQDDKTAFPTVERPHGEWIEHRIEYINYFVSEYECSNCHDDLFQKTEWCFCPNCGARMQKEGEAE